MKNILTGIGVTLLALSTFMLGATFYQAYQVFFNQPNH